jgi:hypothetical protein
VWCFSKPAAVSSLWNFTTRSDSANVVIESDQTIATSNAFIAPAAQGSPLLKLGTDGGNEIYSEEVAGPLDTFKLVLNGQDRFKEQKGKYFNQVQAYQHHTGAPCPGIYSYSFALKPEEHQPTGTCNFSRIDNAQVAVTPVAVQNGATSMHMFATNYNVLRIQSGMGGLAFSN